MLCGSLWLVLLQAHHLHSLIELRIDTLMLPLLLLGDHANPLLTWILLLSLNRRCISICSFRCTGSDWLLLKRLALCYECGWYRACHVATHAHKWICATCGRKMSWMRIEELAIVLDLMATTTVDDLAALVIAGWWCYSPSWLECLTRVVLHHLVTLHCAVWRSWGRGWLLEEVWEE